MCYQVAESAADAKEKIKSMHPDIVILDLKLTPDIPEDNFGGLLIEKMIRHDHFCPIVIYSGFTETYNEDHPFINVVTKGSGSEEKVMNAIQGFRPYVLALQDIANSVRRKLLEAFRDVAPYVLGADPRRS